MQYQYMGYTNPGVPMEIYQGNSIMQQQIQPVMYQQPQQQMMRPQVPPEIANYRPPEVVMGNPEDHKTKTGMFTVVKEGHVSNPVKVIDTPVPETPEEKKHGRKKKEETGIVPAKDKETPATVEDAPTSYTYMETTGLLRETMAQIDALNGELVNEFQNVRQSRTMKNKYNVLVGISENIGSLIGNRIQAIKEINNSISKSNEMDYKKLKDIKAAQAVMNDDKYIADVYQALISNPQNMPAQMAMPQVDSSIFGSGIVRANITGQMGDGPIDAGYLNYLSNLSPEQNLMRYEGNPNIKQVVVYDAATNNKFFQMMDTSTGEVIPNVPVYDQTIMEDTTLDIDHMIAKNINLNETFPIIMINNDVVSQY